MLNLAGSISMTIEELKEFNKKQFNLVETLRSQGKLLEADQVERVAIITNRNLVLGLPSFDIPSINLQEKVTSSIKIYRIDPGLLGGGKVNICMVNYTRHKITFKTSSISAGNFTTTPADKVTSLVNTPVTISIEEPFMNDIISVASFFNSSYYFVNQMVLTGAASISFDVRTQTASYTVALGIIATGSGKNRAGIEIRSTDLRLGSDKQTVNGVDVSGLVSDLSALCSHKHIGTDSEDCFFESVTSSNPEESFKVKCSFSNTKFPTFNFWFCPLHWM